MPPVCDALVSACVPPPVALCDRSVNSCCLPASTALHGVPGGGLFPLTCPRASLGAWSTLKLYRTPANGFIGTDGFFGIGFYAIDATTGVISPLASCDADGCQSTMLSWFFQWAFCTAGATIVSGGVAERVKSPTYAVYAFCMTSFIYRVVVAWTWGYGWLDSVLDVGSRATPLHIGLRPVYYCKPD